MHRAVGKFIKEVRSGFPHKFRNRTICEVGAHNINGSVRKYFWFCRWTGVDITPGKGVDIVGNFMDIDFTKKYQVVVSTEMLEHCKDWKESLVKMYKILQPGGLLIITCAGPDRKIHGVRNHAPEASPDTTDYYKNLSTDEFRSVLPMNLFDEYVLMYERGLNDLQFYGIKKYKK